MAIQLNERETLREMMPVWQMQGYEVILEPDQAQVPQFLGNFRPDAIARRAVPPHLVIEIMRNRGAASLSKIRQIQSLFAGHEDWKLQVVYLPDEDADVASISVSEIKSARANVEALAKTSTQAALLLGWSTLEAAVRTIDEAAKTRNLSSSSLADFLISQGYITQERGSELRKIANLRGKLAHGQLNLEIDPEHVRVLTEMIDELLSVRQ